MWRGQFRINPLKEKGKSKKVKLSRNNLVTRFVVRRGMPRHVRNQPVRVKLVHFALVQRLTWADMPWHVPTVLKNFCKRKANFLKNYFGKSPGGGTGTGATGATAGADMAIPSSRNLMKIFFKSSCRAE